MIWYVDLSSEINIKKPQQLMVKLDNLGLGLEHNYLTWTTLTLVI